MNSSVLLLNIDNTTTPEILTTSKIISAVILLLTFVFGLIMNSLYFWVLQFRMRKTINTTWFLQLILANLFYTLLLPFVAVYFLTKPHWILGLFMCKFVNSFLSLSMHGSVFVLTAISLDRYLLVFNPHWYRRHMNPRKALLISLVLWAVALLYSSPYLIFRQIKSSGNKSICYNDYTIFGDWEEKSIKWSLFSFRLLAGFIIPLAIIMFCYLRIFTKMKMEHLARSTRTYKIIFTAILSFFTTYTPYHLWYGMSMERGKIPQNILQSLQILTICLSSINYCLVPVLYLFIVDSFKNVFQKSLVALIELVINENYSSTIRSLEEKKETPSIPNVSDDKYVT
ncbi:putative G-protein coupled receptor 33 [Gastrophryne carolinensis]